LFRPPCDMRSAWESLVAKADYRILTRGAMRRHDSEREAHGERHAEGDYHREVGHNRLDARESLDGGAETAADENPGHAADDADEHRLAQKLQQDVPPRGPDRAAHADPLRARGRCRKRRR